MSVSTLVEQAGWILNDRDTRAMYITRTSPIAREEDDEFEIEVIESRRFALRINPMYTRLAAHLHRTATA